MTLCVFFFFFNDTATTEIYTLSLHDALPISRADLPGGGTHLDGGHGRPHRRRGLQDRRRDRPFEARCAELRAGEVDRKSTRLNSSHANISYAVFCLKKKNKLQAITY